jgi:hypothetical protein
MVRFVTVTVCKRSISQPGPGAGNVITTPDGMYLWCLRLLLERVSWLVRDDPRDGWAQVTIAHLKRFKREGLDGYVEKLRGSQGVKIAWSVLPAGSFRISTPEKVDMLQVADIAVSASFKAVEPDNYGHVARLAQQPLGAPGTSSDRLWTRGPRSETLTVPRWG